MIGILDLKTEDVISIYSRLIDRYTSIGLIPEGRRDVTWYRTQRLW